MEFNVAILDDSEMDRKRIEYIVHNYVEQKGINCCITSYEKAELLLLDAREGKCCDLYLLDMRLLGQMEENGSEGLQVAYEIRKLFPDPFIIYITNYMEQATEGYEVGAFRYISKDSLDDKLPDALSALLPKMAEIDCSSYIVKKNNEVQRILYRDIYYIQKEGKYILICHKNGICRERKALKTIFTEIDGRDFCYIDQGCLINLRNVEACQRDQIRLKDNIILPVSRTRFNELKERLLDLWRGADR